MTQHAAATSGRGIQSLRSLNRRRSIRSVTVAGLLTSVVFLIAARHARQLFRRADRNAQRVKPLPPDLLATLAHELRTPLNSIVGWTNVLQSGKADATVTAVALRSISSSAQAQRRLIEDLVDTTQAENQAMRLRREVLDLRSPILTAIDVVRPSAESANLFLSVALPSAPCPVSGDGDRLQQAFGNVLTNAVKFTRSGGIHVALVKREREYRGSCGRYREGH